MREALDDLAALADVDAERLRAEPLTRAAAERLIQVVVDLAIDVNAHVATAELGRAPVTARGSFVDAAAAGAIDAELADRLTPTAGLRNVLVHRYVDIDVDVVAASVTPILRDYGAWVHQVSSWLGGQADSTR
ncbi:MAG TPA: HepT-like ribonuclease domain-containing protein [Acidimicrobiales bacterium]|nr:HepT-like ribonuclease domain-containing protein [Acidimicrobiales bacterium]